MHIFSIMVFIFYDEIFKFNAIYMKLKDQSIYFIVTGNN